MNKEASMYGSKLYLILKKLPETIVPAIIAALLRHYDKHGLAELVEQGWDWTPRR